MPFFLQYRSKSAEVYCAPRSEWKITPVGGLRLAIAISKAAVTSSVRIWSAMAHPTSLREYRSITVIMWNQVCQALPGVALCDLDDGELRDGRWDPNLVRSGSGGGGDVDESCEEGVHGAVPVVDGTGRPGSCRSCRPTRRIR